MPSNYQNSQEKDAGDVQVSDIIDKTELSPFLKNISIAAFVGIIAFIGVSSLIIAATKNSVIEVEKKESK